MGTELPSDAIPAALRSIHQWVGWKYLPPEKPGGKRRKLPVNPCTGKAASSTNRRTWGTFDQAMAAAAKWRLAGIGLVFTPEYGLAGVDFDECIIDGQVVPEVQEALRTLNSYTEVSPSGTGLKVWVRAAKPDGVTDCKCYGVLGCKCVEVYDNDRFFTVTGQHWPGTPGTVEDRQEALTALCARLWPESSRQPTLAPGTRQQPTAQAREVSDWADAMERCRKYLAKVRDSLEGQDGSGALYRAACETQRFALPDEEAIAVLRWFNEAKAEPKWTETELRHKLQGAKSEVADTAEVGIRNRRSINGRPRHAPGVRVPEWIRQLQRPKLRPHQRVILQAIVECDNARAVDAYGSVSAVMGYVRLTEKTGMSRLTAIRHVGRLIAMGLLYKLERGGIDWQTGDVTANKYFIPGAEGVKPHGVSE